MPTNAAVLALDPRRLRPTRMHVGLVIGIVVSLWVVLVFGRALTALNEANARVEGMHAENVALEVRLDQANREAQIVQSDAFVRFAARAYGMGRPGERAFALEQGAPPPEPVPLLGGPVASPPDTPLDSWLRLLFGD